MSGPAGRQARQRTYQRSRSDSHVRRDFVASFRRPSGSTRTLPAKQLGVLLLLRLVDQPDVAVRDALDLFEALSLVVLGNLMVLEQLLQTIVRLTADVADGIAALFRKLVDVAGEFFPALLGQGRDRNAD